MSSYLLFELVLRACAEALCMDLYGSYDYCYVSDAFPIPCRC